ncbi:GntR family transcriptional regulator [Nocardia sp. NPDC004278]
MPGAIVERLYQDLRRAILGCELAPDSIISQVQLAKRFGVSRTPLREVLRLLERDGLVESRHNKRVRISGFSLHDLEQVAASRVLLEAAAARAALRSTTPATIEQMENNLIAMHEAARHGDLQSWRKAHHDFHSAITEPAGHRLEQSINELRDIADRYRAIYAAHARLAWKRGLKHHTAILDSVRTYDTQAVGETVGNHIALAAQALIAAVDPDYNPVLIKESVRMISGSPAGTPQPIRSVPSRQSDLLGDGH